MSSIQLTQTITHFQATVKRIMDTDHESEEFKEFVSYGAKALIAKTLKEVLENKSADPIRADLFIATVMEESEKLITLLNTTTEDDDEVNEDFVNMIPFDTPFQTGEKDIWFVRYSSGMIYIGQMFNGFMHGHGYVKWSDGDTYEGSFKNGAMYGEGLMTYANGDTHKGKWKDGLKCGKGRQIVSGVKTCGIWKNDLKLKYF